MRFAIKNFKTNYASNTGLLCFSEDWSEPLMWSHYAEKHRGICLGFDVRRDSLQKVKYQDERILAELGDDSSPKDLSPALQAQLLCTKSRGWSYEAEQRMFIPVAEAVADGSLHFVPLSPAMKLAEVILGPLCNQKIGSARQLVKSLHRDVVVFKSRLAFQSFKVVPDERTII